MTVITFSREIGSGGDDVATLVAERLGLRRVGREIINRAAQDAGAGEAALAEIDELGLLGVKPSPAARKQYCEQVRMVIEEQARQGDVLLVGRGGQVVLSAWRDVLHVRITAPREMRCAAVEVRCKVSPEVAAARVDASDRARAAFHKRNYGVRWDDPALYDLVVNMARLSVPMVVDTICAAARAQISGRRAFAPEGCVS
jgi:cytidylate kinase